MALHVASMVRNEAGRFLSSALDAWGRFADEILVLDDSSTDDSREIATRAGAYVVDAEGLGVAWGSEAPTRAKLFDVAWNIARLGDYIFILDADMIPARNPRIFMDAGADVVFFALFDLWSTKPLKYREDTFWQGHNHPRAWMVRKMVHGHVSWEWSTRGIHCGHLPLNFKGESGIFAPRDASLLHYAYATPELRADKYAAYAKVAAQLSDHEIAHARSIMDENPETFLLEFTPEYTL